MTDSLNALLAVAALARDAERRRTYQTNMIALRKQVIAAQQIHRAVFFASADKKAAAKVYRTKMMALTDSMQGQQQKWVLQAFGLDASQPIVIV